MFAVGFVVLPGFSLWALVFWPLRGWGVVGFGGTLAWACGLSVCFFLFRPTPLHPRDFFCVTLGSNVCLALLYLRYD